jgi:DNA-binding beta-propeller fold protein YncE
MTTTPAPGTTTKITAATFDPQSAYPAMMRVGHRYENTLGQRLAFGGFKGPQDVAVGPDGWLYVINRYSEAGTDVARSRMVRVRLDDTGYEDDIICSFSGEPDTPGAETMPSPVMCAMDTSGTLYVTDEHANVVAKFDSVSGDAQGHWGTAGEAPGELNAPSGIALDADENVWVVSSLNHRIERFSSDGEHISGFGKFGTEPGQLNHPWGIAVDAITNTLVVADWRNDRVQRFSFDGELLQVIGSPGNGQGEMNRPSGVAVDSHGDIYVADRSNNRVMMFNPRGMFIESFRGDATLNERGIGKLMTNLDMVRIRENVVDLDKEKRFRNPTAITIGPDGLVLMVDSGRYRIQIYRKLCRELSEAEIDPAAIHVDPELT